MCILMLGSSFTTAGNMSQTLSELTEACVSLASGRGHMGTIAGRREVR